MSVPQSFHRFAEVTRRWSDLAERRLADLADLHCSGRWTRYYSEERLLADLQEAARAVELWSDLVAKVAEYGEPVAPTHPDRRAA